MENKSIIDPTNQKSLVEELVEGRDLTKELYSILQRETSSSSSNNNNTTSNIHEAPTSMRVTQEILSKIERSLAILRYEPTQCNTMGAIDSPLSFNGTPKSPTYSSEGDFKDPIVDCKDDSRKRKVVPRCTMKVQGCCKSGLEGPIDDGFSWRKYGQKDILGTNFPRAYYRCTLRSQGCLATKQVQRSDDDPTYFEVTYRGKHTCYQASSSSSLPYPEPKPKPKPEPNVSPFSQLQETLWNFEIDSKDVKPNVLKRNNNNNNNNNNKASSFPPNMVSNHLGATQFITQNNMPNNNDNNNNSNNNNDNNLFLTRIRDDNLNDNFLRGLGIRDDNLNVTPEFSFDPEDPDFCF